MTRATLIGSSGVHIAPRPRIDMRLLEQRLPDPPHDAADDLTPRRLLVEDLSHSVCRDDARYAHQAERLVDSNFRDDGAK
jgi:hypothetical protein